MVEPWVDVSCWVSVAAGSDVVAQYATNVPRNRCPRSVSGIPVARGQEFSSFSITQKTEPYRLQFARPWKDSQHNTNTHARPSLVDCAACGGRRGECKARALSGKTVQEVCASRKERM
ncbi:chromosome segregation protein SMC [Anopheles sinensis]|uniref:Chromosome segregation protein SMC n=1 Tax=Anopheles sinensis TaxID=74873 RepID=A0A084VXS5_ANOSI|nr:chromosome segregation protein SMC [Anopheles sinensis]